MSERLDRYLAREAFDYLEQIEVALRSPGEVDAGLLRRLSGGVRGSARMAGLEGVEVLAGRMEGALEGVAGGGEGWSSALARRVESTVSDLKRLLAAGERWSAAEDERAREAIARWQPEGSGGSDAEQEIVPVEALFPDDEGVAAPAAAELSGTQPAAVEPGVVPIESLLLDRAAALRLALAQRDALSRRVGELPGGEAVARQVADLFELIEIAATDDPRGE